MKEIIDWKNITVEYIVSSYPSKFLGYKSKNGSKGTVKSYVTSIWNSLEKKEFDAFVKVLIYIMLLERVCLERGFQKIRIRERCKFFDKDGIYYACKMEYIAIGMHVFKEIT